APKRDAAGRASGNLLPLAAQARRGDNHNFTGQYLDAIRFDHRVERERRSGLTLAPATMAAMNKKRPAAHAIAYMAAGASAGAMGGVDRHDLSPSSNGRLPAGSHPRILAESVRRWGPPAENLEEPRALDISAAQPDSDALVREQPALLQHRGKRCRPGTFRNLVCIVEINPDRLGDRLLSGSHAPGFDTRRNSPAHSGSNPAVTANAGGRFDRSGHSSGEARQSPCCAGSAM